MNVEYFIAKKLFTAKEKNNSYTRPIFRIAILAIALSVAVMLIAIMIVTGFKNDISSKIIGFGSHITISSFTNNQSYESEPISINQDFYPSISSDEGIKNINIFATKAAIIKTTDEIHGVVLKGVSSDYDFSFFNNNLVAGEVLDLNDSTKSNDILISEEVSKLLKLNVSDNLIMYFVQDPARVRKFKIKGIYNTAMVDFDKLYVLGDIKHIQVLNSWEDTCVGGFEIAINNFNDLDVITQKVYEQIPYDLNAQSIKEKTPQIFDWLSLQDINVRVILILMLIVGAINMITALLILILERTRLIGILKSLGATNWSVQKIFLYSAVHLIFKGLLLGNAIAFGFALLQKKFLLISLDPATYYMNTVPINFDLTHILMLNIGTVTLCYLILIIPSVIITKITPIKAIRFE
jgi:lipoprotein-releasing system permease protein